MDRRLTASELKALRAQLGTRAAVLRPAVEHALPAAGRDDAAVAALARDVDELARIDRALARIDQPEYGRCVDCSTGIALARLATEPDAVRCTRCQARFTSAA